MAEWQDQILIADHPNPWRDTLIDALRAEAIPILVSHDGDLLRRALVDHAAPPKVVVIGQGLSTVGALEALYLASSVAHSVVTPRRTVRPTFLVTDARTDVELLELYRRRGVTGFLYREDVLDTALHWLRDAFFADRRAAVRLPTKLHVVVVHAGQSVPAIMEDLGEGGCQIVISPKRLEVPLAVGGKLTLSLTADDGQLQCTCEIRRLTRRGSLFGERIVIGLRFVDLTAETTRVVHKVIEDASRQQTIAAPAPEERRTLPRVATSIAEPIEVQIMGADFLEVERAVDISVDGIGIFVAHRFDGYDINTQVELVIKIAGTPSFNAKGQIRHRTGAGQSGSFGIQFVKISDKDRARIAAYVERAEQRGAKL